MYPHNVPILLFRRLVILGGMSNYEIEIKSLLGSPERAAALREKLKEIDPETKLVSQNKQLNHYFEGDDLHALFGALAPKLSAEEKKKFENFVEKGSDFSIRTRLVDEKQLLFVVKASLDEGTSHNTVSRLEFETEITDMTLDELDTLILDSGFSYQAKWSREREEYASKNTTVCLDRNAGYGYLAEFEKVLPEGADIDSAKRELLAFMQEVGVEELPQDRLERMFAFYNAHWPEYYGTEKIFTIE